MSKGVTIFLVDDDAEDRRVFKDALEEVTSKVQLLSAYDGEHALELMNDRKFSNPDIIFMDLNMPRMNGMELLTELRQRRNLTDVPIIVFSTSAMLTYIQQCMQLGADDYLIKPESFAMLVSGIRQKLEKHTNAA